MRRLTVFGFAAALAISTIGCESAANSNVANKTNGNVNANSNVAVVISNNNSNAVNANANGNKSLTREEYDKNKDTYAKEAKEAGSKIGQGLEDGWLFAKTRTALLAADDLRESTINVDVDNGAITLRGTVATDAQKKKAEEVANGIEGKKSVKNDLKVQPKDSAANQMVNGNTTKTNSNAK